MANVGTASAPKVVVPVKSAWLSKINWTQGIAALAMLLTFFGIELDANTQSQMLAGIIGVQAVLTWAMKTFFTSTVTPSSQPPGALSE